MNRIDDVARMIGGYIGDYEDAGLPTDPDYIARALDDAGHLLPDLPEPVADEVGELEWGGIARWEPDGSLHVTDDLYGKTSPHYLRATALDLLAAADYAERNQN